jgi:DNA-directed RNA polymerase subunit beta'
LPEKYRDFRRVLTQNGAKELVELMLKEDGGNQTAAAALNRLKDLGFLASTKSGLSVGIFDLKEDPKKQELLARADELVEKEPGKALDIFYKVTEELESRVKHNLTQDNPMATFMESGAKGKKDQYTRMATMVGLSRDITGRIIPVGVKSSFKEGLSPGEMWVHAFDSRRGLADRSLSTAEPGALTRDIWSSVQDSLITIADCGDQEGIAMPVDDKSVVGRFLAKAIHEPNGDLLFRRGTLIDVLTRDSIRAHKDIKSIQVRSPLTCKAPKGICQKCYGTLPGTNKVPDIGEPVGVIASQAIGEPTSQNIMKTFHGGGVALNKRETASIIPRVVELFNATDTPTNKSILAPIDGRVASVNKDVVTKIVTLEGTEHGKRVVKNIKIPLVKDILVKPGDYVSKGDKLTEEEGAMAPREIMDYKGVRPAQEYMVNELNNLLGESTDKKHVELAISKLTDKVKIDENATSDWLPGQVARRNQVETWNAENSGTKYTLPISETIKIVNNNAGKTYKDRSGNIIIREGDQITLTTIDKLKAIGLKSVEVYAGKIQYTPVIFGVTNNPLKGSENWFSQMGFENLKEPFAEGAVFGKTDVLDEPRSRVMAGKKLNIGEHYHPWKEEFDKLKKSVKSTIANLF